VELKRADLEAKQSVKEGRDIQLLLPVADLKDHWKKKGKRAFKISVKTPNGTERRIL
jgi:hypothetical protein